MYTPSNKKILTTAVLCSLLAASPVWAAQQTTETVNYGTNASTAANPYSKIEVKTTDTDAIGINANVYSDGSSNLQVYMSTDGVINVSAAPTAKDTFSNAYGIQNYRPAASQTDTTLTVTGPTTLTVDSTGGESTGGSGVSGNAYGISLRDSSRTSLEAVKATVTAVGGNVTGMVSAGTNLYTAANAYGVEAAQANLATGAASFTVTAQGGTVSGSASSAKASAYGVKAWGGTTAIGGDLALTIKSAGGTVAENGELAVANADAYGVRISPYMNPGATYPGSLTVNGAITGSITAQGGTAKLASPDNSYNGGNLCKATGIDNDSSTLQADGASLTVTAAGGAFTSSLAEYVSASAEAYGIATSGAHTTSITGATKLTVTATGGTATTKTDAADDSGSAYASAEAYGVGNSYNLYAQTSSGLTVSTLTLGSLAAEVTATAGNAQDIGQPGKNSSAYATAFGISNGTNTTVQNTNPTATIKAASADLTVTAAGGTGADASAAATGIYNSASGGTAATAITGLAKTTVTAAGGNNSTDQSWAYAIGIGNSAYEATKNDSKHTHLAYGTATFQAGSVESTVTATGGSSSAANGIGNVNAFGVTNYGYDENKATLTVTGPSTVAATATANAATPSYVEAMGLYNSGDTSTVMSLQDATVTATATGGNIETGSGATTTASAIRNYGNVTARNLNLTATATGGAQIADVTQTRETDAYGIYSSNGTVSATGAVTVKTSVTPGGGDKEYFAADSLYAERNGTINVGTDGSQATGATVQLEGDVQAASGGTVNLTLATAASYLQGNVQTMTHKTSNGSPDGDEGTVNLTVTNGATWRPVYDNRYGSQNTVDMTNTYDEDGNYLDTIYTYNTPAQTATTTDNSIDTLTLSNGGIVDLTWDNATRSSEFRTLSIGALTGEGGVFKINSDLAKNQADQITLGENSTSTSVGIDVAYDPALAADNLTTASSITGKALVLTDKSGNLASVKGVADSYNLYDYTPTITANGDGTYSLTQLTITNVNANSQSKPMREARHNRMAMHNLWVNGELNNLQKRLGDLRAVKPADSGIWARYEYNKLEKGSDASLKYNMFQLGYDKDYQGETGTFYRGAAFSYAKGTGSYEVSNGDLKEGTLSLYQTWAGKDGRYYDVILKGGKLMSSYDLNDTANPSSADYHSWAYSLSGEIGKRFNKANGFYVEPQFEFTLGKINGADYTTSTGMDVNVSSQNTALARLGISAGRETAKGSYFAKASYYHDFGGGLNLTASDNSTNPYSYGEDSAKNWLVFTLGGTVKAGKNCNIYGELSKFAGQLTNDVQVNVGARWSF